MKFLGLFSLTATAALAARLSDATFDAAPIKFRYPLLQKSILHRNASVSLFGRQEEVRTSREWHVRSSQANNNTSAMQATASATIIHTV